MKNILLKRQNSLPVTITTEGLENLRVGDGVDNGDIGDENTFFGYRAGYNNDTDYNVGDANGTRNVYIGNRAGYGETGGSPNSGGENVAVGSRALRYNTIGYENTAIGDETLQYNTTGYDNIAIGNDAMQGRNGYPITGNYNTAIGIDVCNNIISGNYNLGLGYNAIKNLTTADYNIALGYQAGYNLTTTGTNILIGYKAGYNQTSLSNTIIIDNIARASATEEEEEALLYGIIDANPDNQIVRINGRLGFGTSNPDGKIHVAGTTSDDIAKFDVGVDFNVVLPPTYEDSTITLKNEAGNIDAGEHYYYITYYTPLGETQIGFPTPRSITADATHGKVDIGLTTSNDNRVRGRRIYRTTANSNYWENAKLVVDIADNTTTTYEDNKSDASLTGDNMYFAPNTTCNFLTQNGDSAFFLSSDNVCVGLDAANGILTNKGASQNVLLGKSAGTSLDTAEKSVLIGYRTGFELLTGASNTAVGHSALRDNTSGSANAVLGRNAMLYTGGSSNAILGVSAGRGANGNSINKNVIIGKEAGFNIGNYSQYNVLIGERAGYNIGGRDYNVFVGRRAGYNITGSSNVFLGYYAGYRQTSNNNLLIIDNQDRGSAANEASQCLLYGSFNATPSSQSLTINGNLFLSQIKSGSTQANAGASVNEVWKTSSHASLPDNVLMAGV